MLLVQKFRIGRIIRLEEGGVLLREAHTDGQPKSSIIC